jgi:putative salt-induced outer membrane protein YdiY
MRKYHLWYDFYNTEEEAKRGAERYMQTATPYQRRTYPATYHPYTFCDGKSGWIVWTTR